jgi:hypothetical protein
MNMERNNEENEEYVSPFTRFEDIVPVERLEATRVLIIGAGGIGAPASLCLAKTGIGQIQVWDFDEVDDVNIGPQMYGPKMVGTPKVVALNRFLKQQAPWTKVKAIQDRYENQEMDVDVVVTAVDSLDVRRTVWKAIKDGYLRTKLVVDPRMGAEVLTCHTVTPGEDDGWYEATLEGEALPAPCTAKATFYTGLVAGAMTAQAVKAWLCGEVEKVEYSLDLRYINLLGLTKTDKEAQLEAERHAQEFGEGAPMDDGPPVDEASAAE